jgi:hypothetical protein
LARRLAAQNHFALTALAPTITRQLDISSMLQANHAFEQIASWTPIASLW